LETLETTFIKHCRSALTPTFQSLYGQVDGFISDLAEQTSQSLEAQGAFNQLKKDQLTTLTQQLETDRRQDEQIDVLRTELAEVQFRYQHLQASHGNVSPAAPLALS
jgi:DNA replication initiation complex subunit (GINS family)